MSRFRKLTHTIWYCQYHIVWCPKYRYRVLHGAIGEDVDRNVSSLSSQKKIELVELNVQIDHVHLLIMIPPKLAVSSFVGMVKGKTGSRILSKYRQFIIFLGTTLNSFRLIPFPLQGQRESVPFQGFSMPPFLGEVVY